MQFSDARREQTKSIGHRLYVLLEFPRNKLVIVGAKVVPEGPEVNPSLEELEALWDHIPLRGKDMYAKYLFGEITKAQLSKAWRATPRSTDSFLDLLRLSMLQYFISHLPPTTTFENMCKFLTEKGLILESKLDLAADRILHELGANDKLTVLTLLEKIAPVPREAIIDHICGELNDEELGAKFAKARTTAAGWARLIKRGIQLHLNGEKPDAFEKFLRQKGIHIEQVVEEKTES